MADKVFCTKTNQNISLVSEIANSGEGKVWRTDRNGYLAKIYHDPTPERIQKLEVMIAHPPTDHQASKGHVSYAWATSILKNMQGESIGFLMPEIKQGRELLEVYNPKLRKQKGLEVDWRFLHATAFNIALFIRDIHQAGYVIGDIKPQNILVNPSALPSIIDTDSFQVRNPKTGKIYRCLVGSEGFTPPELLSQDLALTDQTEVQDRFRLGVIIHLLLFGNEPFQGKWIGAGDSPAPDELLKRGWWAYGQNSLIEPSRFTIPLEVVHPEIKRLFLKCFNDGHKTPSMRPSADEWRRGLEAAVQELTVCGKVDTHFLHRGNTCYWCQRKIDLGLDIFGFQRKTPISTNTKVNVVSNQNDIFSVDDILELVKQEGRQITVIGMIDNTPRVNGILYVNFQTTSFYCVMFASAFKKHENTSIINTLQNSQGKYVQFSGLLSTHQKVNSKRPQIILNEPSQIVFLSEVEAINMLKTQQYPQSQNTKSQQVRVPPRRRKVVQQNSISSPNTINHSPQVLPFNPILFTPKTVFSDRSFFDNLSFLIGLVIYSVAIRVLVMILIMMIGPFASLFMGPLAILLFFLAPFIVPFIAIYYLIIEPLAFFVAGFKFLHNDYEYCMNIYKDKLIYKNRFDIVWVCGNEWILNCSGASRCYKSEYQDSILIFDKIIKNNSFNINAYYNRGISYLAIGDYQNSISDFNQLIKLNDKFADAYYGLGYAYSALGNQQESDNNYRIAKSLGRT
jgi:serine/threonine protein kinase